MPGPVSDFRAPASKAPRQQVPDNQEDEKILAPGIATIRGGKKGSSFLVFLENPAEKRPQRK